MLVWRLYTSMYGKNGHFHPVKQRGISNFLLKLSPFYSKRIAVWTSLSNIASAAVMFPNKISYQIGTDCRLIINAIKTPIWVTLIANLLLMVIQKSIKNSSWNFSRLATIVRITLMYHSNCYSFLSEHERDWKKLIKQSQKPPILFLLFD